MKSIKFCVYKESPYYVAQCLNVDVASFDETVESAIANLKEAVELYFEDSTTTEYHQIDEVLVGESLAHGFLFVSQKGATSNIGMRTAIP